MCLRKIVETAELYRNPCQPTAAERSRVSNGKKLLPLTDGRSATARRFKDLVEDIAADLGGKDHLIGRPASAYPQSRDAFR